MPDRFFSDTAKHCVAIFICNSRIGVEANSNDSNATLTFIDFKGKVYGITCKHVVEICKDRDVSEGNICFCTLTKGKYFILNEFICPPSEVFLYPAPDIAIRQMHPDFPQAIGKIPIKLEQNNLPALNTIRHAVAVGYPTKDKRRVDVQNGYCIEMSCVHALAETSSISKSNGQLSLHSELKEPVQVKDFSGMSGGPVFWSTETEYGLLGITYEALPPNPPKKSLGGSPRIAIKAELVTLERFKGWLNQHPQLVEEKKWINSIRLKIYATS